MHGDAEGLQQQGPEQQTAHDADAVVGGREKGQEMFERTDAADNAAAFNVPSTSPLKSHDV